MSNKQEMIYGLCMIALALQVSAISTDNWSVKNVNLSALVPNLPSSDGVDLSMGLWKACGSAWGKANDISGNNISGELDACLHIPIEGMKSFPKNSLYAARTFAILGALLVFAGLVCMMYAKSYKRCQLICLLAGGVSSLIAMGVWSAELLKFKVGDKTQVVKFNPGYSFYMNLVGGLVGLLAAAYCYYGK